MKPRSLVGMTQGARKRKARRLASVIEPGALWRIGERLRPCRGCEACDPRVNDVMRPWCDGTGVLPAKTMTCDDNGEWT